MGEPRPAAAGREKVLDGELDTLLEKIKKAQEK